MSDGSVSSLEILQVKTKSVIGDTTLLGDVKIISPFLHCIFPSYIVLLKGDLSLSIELFFHSTKFLGVTTTC